MDTIFSINHRELVQRHAKETSLQPLAKNSLETTISELKNKASYESRQWRGRGGVLPTSSEVEFDRQLDKISLWMECWSPIQTCHILEELMRHSDYTQINFLNTVLQPSLHRDFMYNARSRFPELEFPPVSTYISRKLKKRLTRLRLDTFYRVGSAYRHTDEDLQPFKLPLLQNTSSSSWQSIPDATICPKTHVCRLSSRKAIQRHRYSKIQSMERWIDGGLESSIPQDAVSRFIKMPLRRHIQNEQMMVKQQNTFTETSNSSKKQSSGVQISSSPVRTPTHQKNRMEKCHKLTIVSRQEMPEEGKKMILWYRTEWNDIKKNEFLHKLLLKLDPRHHYFLSNLISIRQHKDIPGLLPQKLALKILNYLNPKELLIACQVCKKWENLANSNKLWRSKCKEVNMEVPVPSIPNWKNVFKNNLYLRYNWRNGLCRTTDFRGHTESVLCVACDFPFLASGSMDKTIKLWDMETGQLQQTLIGHIGGIWCLQFFTKHLLISGSFDKTIRIWNLRTKAITRTLFGHKGQIWCLKNHGQILVSGSQDRTANIWDIGRCLLIHTLIGHNGAIFSVDISDDSRLVLTASTDKSVRQWLADTGQLIKVIWVSPTTSVMSISYSQGYFVCSYDGIVCLYKGDTLVRTFEEHLERVECVKLKITDAEKNEGYIVSAGKDGLIKLWDITNAKSVRTFKGHNNTVKCIFVNNLYIVSASSDTKIRLWNFNIGMPSEKNEEEQEESGDECDGTDM